MVGQLIHNNGSGNYTEKQPRNLFLRERKLRETHAHVKHRVTRLVITKPTLVKYCLKNIAKT